MFAREAAQPPKPFARIQGSVLDIVGNTIFLGNDESVRLEPKTSLLLAVLAANANQVIRRGDLIDAVWGLEAVGDEALSRQISLLRRVGSGQPGCIGTLETIRKSGYRLQAQVQWLDTFAPRLPSADGPAAASDPAATVQRDASSATHDPEAAAPPEPGAAGTPAPAATPVSSAAAATRHDPDRAPRPATAADASRGSPPQHRPGSRTGRWLTALLTLVTLVAAAIVLHLGPDVTHGRTGPAASGEPTWRLKSGYSRLNASQLIETYPDLAPSGGSVVFSRFGQDSSPNSIVLQVIGRSEERILASGQSLHYFPRFSRDGGRVGFLRSDAESCGIYAVPITGGRVQRLIDCVPESTSAFEWDASGQAILITESTPRNEAWAIVKVTIADGTTTPVTQPGPGQRDRFPRLGADGRTLYFARGGIGADGALLWRQDLVSGEAAAITSEPMHVSGLSPVGEHVLFSDGSELLLVSAEGAVLRASAAEGGLFPSARQVEGEYRFAYSNFGYGTSLYTATMPATDQGAVTLQPAMRSHANDEDPVFLPGSQDTLFVSDRSGGYDVWLGSPSTGDTLKLTALAAEHLEDLAVSADGAYAAVTQPHARGARFRLLALDLRNLDRVQISEIGSMLEDAMAGQFTPDGSRMVFAGRDTQQRWGIYVTPLDRPDQATRLTESGPNVPHVLGNGRVLATTAGAPGLWDVAPNGKGARALYPQLPDAEIAVSGNWLLYAPNPLSAAGEDVALCLLHLGQDESPPQPAGCRAVNAPHILRIMGLDLSMRRDLGEMQVALSAVDETSADIWVNTLEFDRPR